MKDHPIIFSGPMVCALLDGRKTMTRRLAWRDGRAIEGANLRLGHKIERQQFFPASPWQGVRPGDRLYVRENWRVHSWSEDAELWIKYLADDAVRYIEDSDPDQADALCESVCSELDRKGVPKDAEGYYEGTQKLRNRPCIHMPRWASRLTLVVTTTKIERLQEITNEEAEAEGVKCDMSIRGFRDHFAELWKRLHGPEAWDKNPEVVALTFDVHKKNIDAPPKAQSPSPSATPLPEGPR